MRIRKLPVAIALLATFAALACGPEFEQLLVGRKETLATPVGYDFRHAAQRLAAPLVPAARPLAPGASSAAAAQLPADVDSGLARLEGLTPAQLKAIAAVRASEDGDAAFKAGAILPPAYRLYTAAAVDFQAGMPGACSEEDGDGGDAGSAPPPTASAPAEGQADHAACGTVTDDDARHLRLAAARFDALLKLDPKTAAPRAAWAAFSLGRVHHALGEPDPAVAAFRLTRERVAHGANDPLRLATASLGEEARVEWERGDAVKAVTLCQQQAASGGADADIAVNSLRQVAGTLYGDPTRLKAVVADPVLRRLVVTYVLSFGDYHDTPEPPPAGASAAASAPAADSSLGRLNALLDALAALGSTHGALQDADRVAALAYQAGRYPLAARLAAQSTSPLASWIQAKLALRAGRTDEAAERFARAVEAMAAAPDIGTGAAQMDGERLTAEAGTMRLARGEFTQSLALWWQVGDRYWLDLAYVAERVVTTDELKQFVDEHAIADKPALSRAERFGEYDELMNHVDDSGRRLRGLLARRLMRDGRVDEALAYFHPPCKCQDDPDPRAQAVAYRKGLQDAQAAKTPLQRAKIRFATAQRVRENGLDLFGYELGPDDVAAGGDYQFNDERPTVDKLATPAEIARYKQADAKPDGRFHYRGQAALIAAQAADDLPPRSQAYAAVLCRAGAWTKERQPEIFQAMYKRYVRTGAAFPWAAHFGSDCPAPDFKRLK